MSGALEKSLAILELMVEHPGGLPVSTIAERLDQPVSGVHRQLKELARLGYVRQERSQGDYALTIKLAAMGLGFLGRSGVTDVAQPILDRLAQQTGELIRLSVVDGDDLTWVAVAQGATGGLRYDPGQEQGVTVHLASSAGGQALLSTMTDEAAMAAVSRQGILRPGMSPARGTPRTVQDLLEILRATRARGYSVAVDSYLDGMAAMAVPVRYHGDGPVLGCLSVAGPAVRMTPETMERDIVFLREAAADMGEAADGSRFFARLRRTCETAGA